MTRPESSRSPMWYWSREQKLEAVRRLTGKQVLVRYSPDGTRTNATEITGWIQPFTSNAPYTFIVTLVNTPLKKQHQAVLFSRLMDVQPTGGPDLPPRSTR